MKKIYYYIYLALILGFPLTEIKAQWVQLNGPYIGPYNATYCFAVSDSNLFAGTSSGVFLSTNNGTNWTAVNAGLTNTFVYSLTLSGSNLFAGTIGDGVFLSTNNGTSWTAVNNGLSNKDVRYLTVGGTNLSNLCHPTKWWLCHVFL